MVKARKWIIAKAFAGEPKITDFKVIEEDLPTLKNGGCNFLWNFFNLICIFKKIIIENVFRVPGRGSFLQRRPLHEVHKFA